MGCPTTCNGYTATWTRGKLSKLTKGSRITGTETYNYTYNSFGQRIGINYNYMAGTSSSSAIVMGMLTSYSHTFRYDRSGRLICESKTSQYYGEGSSNEQIVYLYDETGIIGMVHTTESGTTTAYYFQRNLLGDVIGIYTTGGTKVGGYTYDAWGNCTITLNTNGIATKNPIRYRGYYYDEVSGLYYLNARYYSPEWRRFILPDDTAYLDAENPNGLNLYCFCGNNPISYFCNNLRNYFFPTINRINNINTSRWIRSTNNRSTTRPLSFSVGVITPEKYDLPSWMSIYAFYAKGSLGWGYTFGDGYSLASFGIGILDVTFHTPKWFSSLLDDHLANPNIYLGLGIWNANVSVGVGVSGTAEIISGTIGIQFGDAVSVGVKGYVGIGFTFDFTNGFSFGIGWGLGYEISLVIDWYELFH